MVMPCIKQPKGTRNSVRVPTREQAGGQTYNVRKNWHADGQHECCTVHHYDQYGPCSPPNKRVLMQMPLMIPKQPDEEQLGSGVRVQ